MKCSEIDIFLDSTDKKAIKESLLRYVITLVFIILMTFMAGCSVADFAGKDSIDNLSFSHDGKKVVFDRCRYESCQIQVYDLATGELAAYQSPKNEQWTMGKYAYDGKKIAFSVIPQKAGGGHDLGAMQIAVMDADGKNLKKVTTGPGAKLYPAFSHNGKKILYACAAYIRTKGGTPAAQYDAWEVNLETGVQTQLTFFKYFDMGYLTYFPDDERFIYWGNMPDVYEGVGVMNVGAFQEKMIELGKKGISISGLAVMKGRELTPSPYHSFPSESFPQRPLLSKDGSVMIYEKSGSGDFYLYSEDGKHRYIGGSGSVDSAAISPDGLLLATISVDITLDTFTVQDGKRKHILYLSCAPKKIQNWENALRGSESLYKMIPEIPSRILNR